MLFPLPARTHLPGATLPSCRRACVSFHSVCSPASIRPVHPGWALVRASPRRLDASAMSGTSPEEASEASPIAPLKSSLAVFWRGVFGRVLPSSRSNSDKPLVWPPIRSVSVRSRFFKGASLRFGPANVVSIQHGTCTGAAFAKKSGVSVIHRVC